MQYEWAWLKRIVFTWLACGTTVMADKFDWALEPSLTNHVISADSDGFARFPDSRCEQARGGATFSTNQFEAYLESILKTAHHWANEKGLTNAAGESVTRILIYVHGGLNKFSETATRAAQLAPVMMADTNHAQYPIFLAWPSDFQSTYKQHVTEIRQGVHEKTGLNLASAPIVTAVDVAMVPVTLPAEWWNQLLNLRDRTQVFRNFTLKSRLGSAATNTRVSLNWTNRIESSLYEGGFRQEPFKQTGLALLTPVRATIGTLGQGALAQESWRMMKRRTTNILFPPQSIQPIPQLGPQGDKVNAATSSSGWASKCRIRPIVKPKKKSRTNDANWRSRWWATAWGRSS